MEPNNTVRKGDWFCQTCGRPSCKASSEPHEICGCKVPKWMVMDEMTGDTVLPPPYWQARYPENCGTLGLPWE